LLTLHVTRISADLSFYVIVLSGILDYLFTFISTKLTVNHMPELPPIYKHAVIGAQSTRTAASLFKSLIVLNEIKYD